MIASSIGSAKSVPHDTGNVDPVGRPATTTRDRDPAGHEHRAAGDATERSGSGVGRSMNERRDPVEDERQRDDRARR